MRKGLAILILFAIGMPVHGEKESPKSGSDQKQTDDGEKQPPPSAKATCVIKQEGTTIECDWPQANAPSYFHRLISAENLPNLLLFLIGLGGIVAAIITLRKVERQILVAEDGTKAMIRVERAWLVVSVDSIVPGEFRFWVTNVGNTPAKVDSIWSCNITLMRGEELTIPPDEQTQESLLRSPQCLIPPDAKQIIWQCTVGEFQKASGGGDGEKSLFSRGFSSAYIFGRIRYFNVLDTKATIANETRWLYWLVPVKDAMPFPDPRHSKHNTYT
jgi:hypothetical protein